MRIRPLILAVALVAFSVGGEGFAQSCSATLAETEAAISIPAERLLVHSADVRFPFDSADAAIFNLGKLSKTTAPDVADGTEHEEINNGQDFTRPVRRFDVLPQFDWSVEFRIGFFFCEQRIRSRH